MGLVIASYNNWPITLPNATDTSDGIMSAADKLKLDSLSPGSELPPQPGNAGKLLTTNGTSASWTNIFTGSSYEFVTPGGIIVLSNPDGTGPYIYGPGGPGDAAEIWFTNLSNGLAGLRQQDAAPGASAAGFQLYVEAAGGGRATAVLPGGTGALTIIAGGLGGNGNALQAAGGGGLTRVRGGFGGTNGGAGGGPGGNFELDAGAGTNGVHGVLLLGTATGLTRSILIGDAAIPLTIASITAVASIIAPTGSAGVGIVVGSGKVIALGDGTGAGIQANDPIQTSLRLIGGSGLKFTGVDSLSGFAPGAITHDSGAGGNANAGNNANRGGIAKFSSGKGGDGTASKAPERAGDVYLVPGVSGTYNGFGSIVGASVVLDGGAGANGAGGGAVDIGTNYAPAAGSTSEIDIGTDAVTQTKFFGHGIATRPIAAAAFPTIASTANIMPQSQCTNITGTATITLIFSPFFSDGPGTFRGVIQLYSHDGFSLGSGGNINTSIPVLITAGRFVELLFDGTTWYLPSGI